VSVYIQELDHF